MGIIQVENISKRYIISHKSGQKFKYNSLGESINNQMKTFFGFGRNADNSRENKREEFWALNNVSFEVNQSNKIGIIGRNGAGKSTLLKILSRITEPTKGRVKIKGRVASLLEVGTGFHPELTGRENIFLNGAILGMKKDEIKKKFDEIVAFSEIDKFLDTPVKRYSSGMYVRLAFSVAAHLEPEILLVDEVLAVGDYEFQKKCLGKMKDVSKQGRTIIFVSHDMNAINNLCDKALLLEKGMNLYLGRTKDTIEKYLDFSKKSFSSCEATTLCNEIKFFYIKVKQDEKYTDIIDCREDFLIEVKYEVQELIKNMRVNFIFTNQSSEYLFGTSDLDLIMGNTKTIPGTYINKVTIPGGLLKIGSIFISLYIDVPKTRSIFIHENAKEIRIFDSIDNAFSERHRRKGLLAPLLKWQKLKL